VEFVLTFMDSLIIENIIKPLGFSIVNEPSETDNMECHL
ncbi:(dimethylallyl)adenosine tRNA methylthiotransferase, partial [Ehrlichia ruminantium]